MKLDLRGAYNLVRIKDGDEWKTAFRSWFGHFKWLVMPFGLTNALAAFQGLMNNILRECLDCFASAFLDDIIIYSRTLEEHKRHVTEVLEQLAKAGLYLKRKKCEFHKTEIEFLGVIIGHGTIRMDPAKVKAITDWPTPTRVKEVQAFLSLMNFYRWFIWNYSGRSLGLTALLKKDVKFEWTKAAEESFMALKQAFLAADFLAQFDPDWPAIVETDASDYALGGCVSQIDPKTGMLRPVAFYSRKLTEAES